MPALATCLMSPGRCRHLPKDGREVLVTVGAGHRGGLGDTWLGHSVPVRGRAVGAAGRIMVAKSLLLVLGAFP